MTNLYLDWLEGGKTLNAVSLLVGAVGLYLSYHFYEKSKRDKWLTYWPNTYPLLKETIKQVDGLQVLHNGEPIPSLSVTRVAVWNAGNEEIRRQDIATSDPIRISAPTNAGVLDAKITYAHKPANLIKISREGDVLTIDFEYLGFEDGCIINIYHTQSATFTLSGSIIGMDRIECAKSGHPQSKMRRDTPALLRLFAPRFSKEHGRPKRKIKSIPRDYLDK